MGQIFKLIIILLWLPQAVGQQLSWVYWWQVKEYRVDRFKAFLLTPNGRRNLYLYPILFKILLLTFSLFIYQFAWLAFFVFSILDILFFHKGIRRKVRRPIFTQRAQKIFLLTALSSLLIVVGVFLVPVSSYNSVLLFGEIILLISPLLGIYLTFKIVTKVKDEEILRAKKKLNRVKPKIIGITGSYGKTTTKDFIAHLLSQKYKVAKTKGSQNTEFGIARNIQKSVLSKTQFLVLEMGAYKSGEIARLASIAKPDVGIISGIEEQHLSLFGKLGNIKKTKFELIESLPKGGVAIFNLTNSHCRELSLKAKKQLGRLNVLGYYFQKKGEVLLKEANIVSRVIAADPDGVTFEIKHKKTKKTLFAPVHGVHFVENLTCAILVARLFGISWQKIAKRCRTIKVSEGIMQLRKLKSGIIIDDTYNSTPAGFKAALSYLSLYELKKAVITSGIIELGNKTYVVHKKLGELMKDSVDKIILTNSDYSKGIRDGLGQCKFKLIVEERIDNIERLASRLMEDNYVILLEGRQSKRLMDYMKPVLKLTHQLR